jgi:hypothetical protein
VTVRRAAAASGRVSSQQSATESRSDSDLSGPAGPAGGGPSRTPGAAARPGGEQAGLPLHRVAVTAACGGAAAPAAGGDAGRYSVPETQASESSSDPSSSHLEGWVMLYNPPPLLYNRVLSSLLCYITHLACYLTYRGVLLYRYYITPCHEGVLYGIQGALFYNMTQVLHNIC